MSMTNRRMITVAVLTLVWCALWGEVTIANLVSGVIVATVAASVSRPAGRGGVRLQPLVRFGSAVAVDLFRSSLTVAGEILSPADRTDEAIIAVRLPTESRRHLLLLIVSVTVTPGTAVVDADPDTGTLYLHVLHADTRDAVQNHVRHLAELACAALPLPTEPTRSVT